MVRYEGQIFGFNYDIEKANDAEFIDWLIGKLKVRFSIELWSQIVTRLLQQSDEYQQARVVIQNHETRIRALEAK